jgi:hypothetical protein
LQAVSKMGRNSHATVDRFMNRLRRVVAPLIIDSS